MKPVGLLWVERISIQDGIKGFGAMTSGHGSQN